MRIIKRIYKFIKVFIIFFFFLSFFPSIKGSNASLLEWENIYGGAGQNILSDLIQTSDNGFLFAGLTNSYENNGTDFWLVKANNNGTMDWHKFFGLEYNDNAYSVIETKDNNYSFVGFVTSTDGDLDILFVKTDYDGEILWYKILGDKTDNKQATTLTQTDIGEFVISGFHSEINGDYDALLIKTNVEGDEKWERTYGGRGLENIWSHIQTKDGGYVLAGCTNSFGSGGYDFWLVKTDENGDMLWNRTFGGKEDDVARSVIETDDGDLIIAGYSEIIFYYDYFVVKTDSNGYIEWSKNFSGLSDSYLSSIIQTKDGGYILGGFSRFSKSLSGFYVLKTHIIEDNNTNLYPIANAGYDVTGKLESNILFNGTGFDADGEIKKYSWDFNGDGTIDYESNTSANTSFTYTDEGIYYALLEITDNNGSKSTDMCKITINNDEEKISPNKISLYTWFVFIITILGLSVLFNIINKTLKNKNQKKLYKYFQFIKKTDKWILYLFFSFLFMISIKFMISLYFSTPHIVNDEYIYGVVAGDIFQGKFVIFGNTDFAAASPPAGYPYLLSPAYILGNNMDDVYHGMLFINSILSAIVIIPVFFIMKKFVDNKISFYTAILIGFLPTILAHNYVLLSENAFYPLFLVSCYFLIKTFSYKNFDKNFILYSLLLGLSIGLLIMVKAMGIAMLGSLLLVYIYRLAKYRNISALKYGLCFFTFLPVIGYFLLKSESSLLGYPGSSYFDSMNLIFSDFSHFIHFLNLMLNEASYFVLMSYFIFFTFTIFLLLNLKKYTKEKRENIVYLSLYGILSAFFLIFITSIHLFGGREFNLYSRYVNVVLPIFFMLGIIGIMFFQKIENKKAGLYLRSIFIFSTLFFIIIFPSSGIKIVNSLDLSWIKLLNNHIFLNISAFNLFKILLGCILIYLVWDIGFNWFFNKKILPIKNTSKNFIIIILSIFVISLFIFASSIDHMYNQNELALKYKRSEPARWFMENDPDAHIIFEDPFSAFSGAGITIMDWQIIYDHLYFWNPNAKIEKMSRIDLKNAVEKGEVDADYILSTHDLTLYYPSVEDFYMNIYVNPIKNQEKADWHIYKVK